MRLYRRGRTWWCSGPGVARHSTGCTDEKAAKLYVARIERTRADPDRAAAEGATLADAIADVIVEYEADQRDRRKSEATVEFYRKRARQLGRMIAEGHLPPLLSELRARHIDAMVAVRRAEGSSRATIAKDLILVRLALKLAKRRGQWRGDVDELLPHRFGGSSTPRERWLTHAELWQLLGALRPERAAWVAFAVATGANLSECAKARRDDVILRGDVPDRVRLRGTKRASRLRWVPIVRPWQRALLQAALSAAGKVELWDWTSVDRDLDGGANQDLRRAARRVGLEALSTNDLRRTFATWMVADGVDRAAVSDAMGHADGRMLARHYAHLTLEQLAALVRGPGDCAEFVPTPSDQGHKKDSAEPACVADSAEFGSSCWTRTSDPVINSHRTSAVLGLGSEAGCADSVRELRGLAKCAAVLGAEWDWLEAVEAGA